MAAVTNTTDQPNIGNIMSEDILPKDCVLEIFNKLDLHSLISMGNCCRYFRHVKLNFDDIWIRSIISKSRKPGATLEALKEHGDVLRYINEKPELLSTIDMGELKRFFFHVIAENIPDAANLVITHKRFQNFEESDLYGDFGLSRAFLVAAETGNVELMKKMLEQPIFKSLVSWTSPCNGGMLYGLDAALEAASYKKQIIAMEFIMTDSRAKEIDPDFVEKCFSRAREK